MTNRFTEGLTNVGDKYRLVETLSVATESLERLPLTESKILCEGKEYNARVGYRFKIWDSNFNANGRNYANVIPLIMGTNPLPTTISLMNHPENDPDTRDICGVCKDPRVDEDGWLSVAFYPCGTHGQTVEDVITIGGPIEVSSSCLGDLDSNGYVLTEGLILERYLDIVTNCSNRLVQYSDKVELRDDNGKTNLVSESGTIEKENIITEKTTNVKNLHGDNTLVEKNISKGEKTMSENLLEATLQMNVKSMIKDSNKTENLYEKKEILESAHSYAKELTDKSLVEEINKIISETDEQLKVLSEKGMKTDELSESVETLTTEKKKLEEEITALKEESEKLEKKLKVISTMYEEKQYKAGEDEFLKNRRMAKEVCGLKLKARRQENEILSLKAKNRTLTEKARKFEATTNTKVEAEDYLALQEEVNSLRLENHKLTESVKTLRSNRIKETTRPSRFESVRESLKREDRRVVRKEDNEKVESQKSTFTEKTVDEDDLMEQMLSGKIK
jgi:hypothetical protein